MKIYKKNIGYKYTITIILTLCFTNFLISQDIVSNSVRTVVIDAGHGGKDPGAKGKYSFEKDVTLAIALKTGEYIKSLHPDVEVIYTRTTDVFLKLSERANVANKHKADLFISIHANSTHNHDASGVEFYVLGLHKSEANLEVAKKENSVIEQEEGNVVENYGFDPNSTEGNIIMTMKQSLYLDKSVKLAKSIENNMASTTGQRNRGTKQAGFVVLYKTSMPSVLVETGFISNAKEEDYLNSKEGQEEIAESIALAFSSYKSKFEDGTNVATEVPISATVHKHEEHTTPKSEKSTITPKEVVAKDYPVIKEEIKELKKEVEVEQTVANNEIKKQFEKQFDPPVKEAGKINKAKDYAKMSSSQAKEEIIKSKIKMKTISMPKKVDNATKVVDDYPVVNVDNTPTVTDNTPADVTVYKVQVKASSRELSTSDKIFNIDENIETSFENGMNKYLVGSFTDKNEAINKLKDVKKKGVKDAFLVKYKNGVRF